MYPLIVALLFVAFSSHATSPGKYEYLKAIDPLARFFPIETTPSPATAPPAIVRNLSRFHEDFTDDGLVTFYIGLGKDVAYANPTQVLLQALQLINTKESLGLQDFQSDAKMVRFTNADRSVKYEIEMGIERNEFQQAFSKHEVVMYFGHSRYGRGPAFETYSNYFRMGSVFDVIEVEAQNRYFLNEPIKKTQEFPVQQIDLGGTRYDYQYVDEKVPSSHLPPGTYVKNIPGYDKDLRATQYLNGRQIFFFLSCSNANYFLKPIRNLFPNPLDKFVFGTKIELFGGIVPLAVMVTQIAKEEPDSAKYVTALNETKTCDHSKVIDCYTAY